MLTIIRDPQGRFCVVETTETGQKVHGCYRTALRAVQKREQIEESRKKKEKPCPPSRT